MRAIIEDLSPYLIFRFIKVIETVFIGEWQGSQLGILLKKDKAAIGLTS